MRDKANPVLPYKLAGLLVPKRPAMKQHPLLLDSMIILQMVLESTVWSTSVPEVVPGGHGLMAYLYPGYWMTINDVVIPFTKKNSSSAVSEPSLLLCPFLEEALEKTNLFFSWK